MIVPVPRALQVLDQGGLMIYPTDTLWGLGARLDRPEAVDRVFAVKERPRSRPLTIAVAGVDRIERYALVTPTARRLFALLPGPLTLVLEKRPTVPDAVTSGRSDVGVRVPDHPVALELLAGVPALTATSANRHGRPDPLTLEEAQAGLRGQVAACSGGPAPSGLPSTIVDARGLVPVVLRAGAVSPARLHEVA